MRQSSPEPKTVLVASAVLLTSTTLVALSYYQIYQTRKTKHVKDLSLLKQLTGHGYLVSILRKYFYQNVSHLQIQNSKLPVDNVQGLEQFCNLVSIDFRGSSLTSTVPQQLFLANLTHLNLSRTKMEEIPVSIGSMVNLVDLDLGRNLIKEVPSEIGKLNKLKFLNLMGNQIVQLPEEICQLKEMYRLGLKSNKLQKLPENIGNLEALVELFITGNQLETLPDSFGGLVNLVKLQASFNQLHSLPSSMGQLESLEMCRVAVNELIKLPSELNNLNKLAWFSLAGTDTAAHAPSPRRDMQQIKIEDISLGNKLGDGASGDVYQCDWNGKQVAVKLFKSDTSPDGQSLDEIELSCALDHPSLVKVLAQVVDTSDKCIGLVTELFHGTPLAAKPNFEYLLRCRWNQDQKFEQGYVIKICKQISDALQYLHSINIAHGDVYAHNVLASTDGNAMLCDMGAAFAYESDDCSRLWEAMEVRAFGLMLKDMVACTINDNQDIQDQLQSLVHVCTESTVLDRANFSYVHSLLCALEQLMK